MVGEARKERYRNEILEAAEKVFAKSGFTNARMEDIAKEAQFAPASLYSYFKSKEELFAEVIQSRSNELLTALTQAEGLDADFPQNIHCLVDRIINFSNSYKEFLKMIILLELSGEPSNREYVQQSLTLTNEVVGIIEKALQKGVNKGLVKFTDANRMAFALYGIFSMMIFRYFSTDNGEDTDQPFSYNTEFIMELFLKGILK